jgi:uncharacterized protein involved in response to NO
LSVLTALGPGFLLGGLMGAAQLFGLSLGPWYAAVRQAHGHAQLLGWGGGLILGVGLHFLPRLRDGDPVPRVARWFWPFALGLAIRLMAQPAAALLGDQAEPLPRALAAAFVLGTTLEAVSVAALLALLVRHLRVGPPLASKSAFAQVMPLLGVAGIGLLGAVASWTAGSWFTLLDPRGPESTVTISPVWDRLGVDLMLLVFIPGVSVAMSARLFPLFFRLPLARPKGLRAAAALFAVTAGGLILGEGLGRPELRGWALAAVSGALLTGVIAVRVFEPRTPRGARCHPELRRGNPFRVDFSLRVEGLAHAR